MVADGHHFDRKRDPDLHYSVKLDPDPYKSENRDSDSNRSVSEPQHWLQMTGMLSVDTVYRCDLSCSIGQFQKLNTESPFPRDNKSVQYTQQGNINLGNDNPTYLNMSNLQVSALQPLYFHNKFVAKRKRNTKMRTGGFFTASWGIFPNFLPPEINQFFSFLLTIFLIFCTLIKLR